MVRQQAETDINNRRDGREAGAQGGVKAPGITHTHGAANHGGIFKMLNTVVVLIY